MYGFHVTLLHPRDLVNLRDRELADTIGMMSIQISMSKSIGELENNGIIARGRDTLSVLNLDEAVEGTGYSDQNTAEQLSRLRYRYL